MLTNRTVLASLSSIETNEVDDALCLNTGILPGDINKSF